MVQEHESTFSECWSCSLHSFTRYLAYPKSFLLLLLISRVVVRSSLLLVFNTTLGVMNTSEDSQASRVRLSDLMWQSDQIWVEATFRELISFHPHFREESLVPSWLRDYRVVRFKGYAILGSSVWSIEQCDVTKQVHLFLHSMFTDKDDRDMMFPNIQMGDTIAMLSPKGKVVSALNYFQVDGTVIIFWLGTRTSMTNMGIAQFLLRLLLKRTRYVFQTNTDNVVVYLLANPVKNKHAVKWYVKRGFLTMDSSPSFATNVMTAFEEHSYSKGLRNYLKPKEDLHWLCKTLDESKDFSYIKRDIYQRMFVNPFEIWKPNVYAILSTTKVSILELDKCTPTSSKTSKTYNKFVLDLFQGPKQGAKKGGDDATTL